MLTFLLALSLIGDYRQSTKWNLPIEVSNRNSISELTLSAIGQYGIMRDSRPGIPAHLHTGIDIKRPFENYDNEPVFPAARGKVISIRDDGPFAQIIIEHKVREGNFVWSVYEHIAGIGVALNEIVDPERPIARFMSEEELNRYGWQFDHIHFELMKVEPVTLKPEKNMPFRYFGTYCLVCLKSSDLERNYHDPFRFFRDQWNEE